MAVTDIVDPRLEAVEMEINYQFSDRSILSEALRAAGSVPITASRSQDNKGLALVGDAAIRMMLILHGHKAHASREMINNILSTRSTNVYLNGRGVHHGLGQYIQRNPSQGKFISEKLMATTVEAIVGAVYIDSEHDNVAVVRVMETLDLFWPEG